MNDSDTPSLGENAQFIEMPVRLNAAQNLEIPKAPNAVMSSASIKSSSCPHSFICPITREVMVNPVSTSDGHSYERESIIKWLRHNKTSPVTGAVLVTTILTVNHALRNSIEEWYKQYTTFSSTEEKAVTTFTSTTYLKSEAATTASDQFILNSTGQLVTKSWLFDHGYTRADCSTVAEHASALRSSIQRQMQRATMLGPRISQAIHDAEISQAALQRQHESTDNCVNQTIDAIQLQVTELLDNKRQELLKQAADEFSAAESRLAENMLELRESRTVIDDELRRLTNSADVTDAELVSKITIYEQSMRNLDSSAANSILVRNPWFDVVSENLLPSACIENIKKSIHSGILCCPVATPTATGDQSCMSSAEGKVVDEPNSVTALRTWPYSKEPLTTVSRVEKLNPTATSFILQDEACTARSPSVIAGGVGGCKQAVKHTAPRLISNRLLKKLGLTIAGTTWKISNTHFDRELAQTLCELLRSNGTAVTKLYLSFHSIDEIGMHQLVDILGKSSSMVLLSCRNCKIGDTEAGAIATAISRNRSFRIVNLDFNKIADEGAVAIANALKENGLIHELTLRSNRIGDIGARALVECPSLAKFNLRENRVGKLGAIAIANALQQNTRIRELNLQSNCIGDTGAVAIAKALPFNNKVVNVYLARNGISCAGALALAASLAANTTVTSFNLRGNAVGKDSIDAIRRAWEDRKGVLQL
eukprot:m.821782 g.821782  ORF g.821782 m.821782 type:complete len:709 (-) comp23402_c0_seq19:1497-3623(-)